MYAEPEKGRWAEEIIEKRNDAQGKVAKYRRVNYQQYKDIPSLSYLGHPDSDDVGAFIKGIAKLTTQADGTEHAFERRLPSGARLRAKGVFNRGPV